MPAQGPATVVDGDVARNRASESREGGLPIGARLEGGVEVVELLGQGSMGLVYRGHDRRLDRVVAIKAFNDERLERPNLRQQFELEARAMASLRHPNVIQVHSLGEYAGTPYFVMEFVDGMDLLTWLEQRGERAVAPDEMLGIMSPVCRGIHALHQAGAVHRDIKPSNILIGSGFRIVLADLGLARPLDDLFLGDRRAVAGTPAYMCPEMILGEDVPRELAPRVDVYALGVVAFELLTGERPVDGAAPLDILQAQVYEQPRVPSEVKPGLGPAFDHVLLQALQKKPAERIESAEALKRGLVEACRRRDADSDRVRVLLVDDDEEFREFVACLLREHLTPVEIDHAGSGQEALDRIKHQQPTVVMVDLHMPNMGGAELTAALRASEKTRHLPIVICTGVGGATDWRVLRLLGADGFLVKPADSEAIVSTIARFADVR